MTKASDPQKTVYKLSRKIQGKNAEIAELKARLDSTEPLQRLPVVNYSKWVDTPLKEKEK